MKENTMRNGKHRISSVTERRNKQRETTTPISQRTKL